MKLKSFSQPLYAILIATAFLTDAFVRDITGAVCCFVGVLAMQGFSIDEISRS